MSVAPKLESHHSLKHARKRRLDFAKLISKINIPLVIAAILLVCFGSLIVYSAILGSSKYAFSRHLVGLGVGLVLMVLLWWFDYRKLSRLVIPLIVIDVFLIISPLLPIIGVNVNGANSWISIAGQQLQPGEFAKIVTIVLLASLVSNYRGKLNKGSDYLKVLGVMFAPIILILLQPDLGTGMVLFVIGIVILFTGGANRRWLIITLLALIVLVVLAFAIDPMVDQMVGHDVFLKDYQKDRLLVFLDNDIDPGGVSYNLEQAKIAIGSGGFSGKGFGMATQSGLGFLPEAPTDFIYCVLAEQFGFVGTLALLLLYIWILASAFATAQITDYLFGSLIIMGIMAMWTFQIIENIGMTSGLMPITGIPLPFMSFGSSFMVVNFMALGLILSVHAHRESEAG